MPKNSWRLHFKRLLWPGTNIVGRDKKGIVKAFLHGTEEKPIQTLDCGCGNAFFSYHAAIRGSRVTGLTIHDIELKSCEEMRDYLGVPVSQIRILRQRIEEFHASNVGQVYFDQVILLDVLEHIRDDRRALQMLNDLLSPGGFIYITVPNRDWQGNIERRVTPDEDGWHVRNGYTFEQLERLLEETGFETIDRFRFGNKGSSWSMRIRDLFPHRVREFFLLVLLPFYRLLSILFSWWPDPHTICVIARKRGE